MELYILVYLCIITIISIITMKADKVKAIKNKRRISEASLITLAVIGGSVGICLGMWLFHHKTKKPKFYIGVPFILIVQFIIAFVLLFN